MDHKTANLAAVGKLESLFTRDDLQSVSRGKLAALIMDVYDILTAPDAPPWWERDERAEQAARAGVLEALK